MNPSKTPALIGKANMLNIFTTLPRFIQLINQFRILNTHEPALDAAHAEGDYEKEREIGLKATNFFVNNIVKKYKLTIDLTGEENIPEKGPVLFVANHQSYCDILMLYYANQKFQMGCIAKEELRKFKLMETSLRCTRSLLINRGDARAAIKTINDAKKMFDQGFSFAIFPEGTRSRSHEMGSFKYGSFKFAQKAKVPIIPVTLDGGYRLFEEHNTFHPCHLRIIVHPIVHYELMDRTEQDQANIDIENTIRDGLKLSEKLDAEKAGNPE